MEINTDRLRIKPLQAEDWKILKEIWQDFDRSPYAGYDRPHSNDYSEIKVICESFLYCVSAR